MTVVRIGLVGASPGSWAYKAHVPAISSLPDARISAIATTRDDSARQASEELSAEAWFTDPVVLAQSDAVDAVAVVVKVPAHLAAVEAALAERKPVYCEWPLALDAVTARRWANLADENDIPTAVGLQALHTPAAVRLQRMIAHGSLGEIRLVEAHGSRARGLTARPITAAGAYTLDVANGAGAREVLGGHLLGLVDRLVGIRSIEGGSLRPQPGRLVDATGETHVVTAPDTFVATGRLLNGGLLSAAWWDRDPEPGTRVVVHGTRGRAELFTPEEAMASINQPQMVPLRLRVTDLEGESRTFEDEPSPLPVLAQNVAASYRRFLDDTLTGSRWSASFSTAACLHELLDSGLPTAAAISQ